MNTIEQLFEKLAASRRLNHSYLLFGNPPPALIKKIANFLETGDWSMPVAPLLDFLAIAADERLTIGIESVKAGSQFLWRKPFRSTHKTLVINQADKLTLPAQSALLKLAEEPPAQSLIFLLLADPAVLITPLVSRFQKVFCGNNSFSPSADMTKISRNFLQSSSIERSAIIKEMVSNEERLREFVGAIIKELDKTPLDNFLALKELNYRWSLISRYNTNKRLQLEAWSQSLNG